MTDAGGTATYSWNARNQLAGISSTGFAASFSYDSFGRRTGKTIQGTTTNFVYDGLNPVQEKNGGTVTANLLSGLGIDEFLTRTDGVGTSALLPDALGSTIALGDGTGTIQTQYTYEPFGSVSQTGSANTSNYKYTGREDDGSGLYYYRARYYHPRLQRFISEDPIGFAGDDVNLYAYVRNNSINLLDPFGLVDKLPSRNIKPSPGDPLGDQLRKIDTEKHLPSKDRNDELKKIEREIKKLPPSERKRILKGFLKVVSRGGTVCLIFKFIEQLLDPDTEQDPNLS